jgi:hypothetical protein
MNVLDARRKWVALEVLARRGMCRIITVTEKIVGKNFIHRSFTMLTDKCFALIAL